MKNSTYLEHIFALQEQILPRHISANADRFAFISQAVELLADPGISQEAWERIPVEMRNIFNYFHSDIFSTIISATRICLHGCDTDAIALMRVALENLTILEYIGTKRLYHSAFLELQDHSRRGKPFSERFSYEAAVKGLGINDRRDRLRGQMSTLGSHASPPRLSLALTQRESINHPKVGLSLDNPSVAAVLGEIASLSLFAVRAVGEIIELYLDALPEEFSKKSAELEKKYEALSNQPSI